MIPMLVLVLGLLLVSSANADVGLSPLPNGGKDVLWISGQIRPSDPDTLKGLIRPHRIVLLDSPGGDVRAAIALGQMLRQMKSWAMIYPGKVCASACVFVLAGAVDKNISGKVGIHRPYQPSDNIVSAEQQKHFYLEIEKEVKKYLNDININPALWDDMIRISPDNIKFLNDDELERYGLSGTDPYIEEARTTEEANSLRISKHELLMRRTRTEKECKKYVNPGTRGPNEAYGICATSIYYGISMDEYKRRAAIAERQCGVKELVINSVCKAV